MRFIFLSLGLLLTILLPTAAIAKEPVIKITRAWVREAPPTAEVNAAFLTLSNLSPKELKLVKVSCDRFDHVEMHTMVEREQMMEMKQVFSIAIPANGATQLKPGALHLMLIQPKKRPLKGERIKFRFRFSDQSNREVVLPVIKKEDEKNFNN